MISLSIVACLACLICGLPKTPVQAQTSSATDDGYFTVYTSIGYDGSNISAYSYYEQDPSDDIDSDVSAPPPEWELGSYGGSYDDSGVGNSF